MDNHFQNIVKVEQIRVKYGAYIYVRPVNWIDRPDTFTWEILWKNGAKAYYGFQDEKPEITSYPEGVEKALEFFDNSF